MFEKLKKHITPRNVFIVIGVIGILAILITGGINAPAGFGN